MMMLKRQLTVLICCAFVLLAVPWADHAALAADKDATKDGGKVAGILIDKNADSITVKADGEDEPVKYVIDASDKSLQAAFKSVFNASRVQLTYKTVGDSRMLVSIKRQVLRASGTVTGEVVKLYNGFWVEVKPKNGLADAYAAGCQLQRQSLHGEAERLATRRLGHDHVHHRLRAAPHQDSAKKCSRPIENRRLISIGNAVEGVGGARRDSAIA
jgi:hypothetical protein